ncbi:MAG: methyltransferase domain-containing protein [Erysipelotrichaceae bacterium]|jgi:SAM-dependent methyltransferase|nr:methyltransferase domain-containing protein [Erysipelotrichaceae bacterium]
MSKIDVFISYRRDGNEETATRLKEYLEDHHYRVFLDREQRTDDYRKNYEKAIEEANDFIIIVTKNYFDKERLFKTPNPHDDDIRNEIRCALRKLQAEKHLPESEKTFKIHPLQVGFEVTLNKRDLPEDIHDIFNVNFIIPCHKDKLKESFHSDIKPHLISVPTTELETKASVYDPLYDDEEARLKVQADNALPSDNDVINRVYQLINKEKLHVLDVGSGPGYVTYTRFNDDRFRKVIGLDINEECIAKANQKYQNEKFSFHHCDIEAPDFEGRLKAIMKEHQLESFDLIFSSLVMHHLAKVSPNIPLAIMHEYLSDGGYIILRGSDDGADLCYPHDNILKEIIEMCYAIPTSSDRMNGRKLYTWLAKAGYEKIKCLSYMRDTSLRGMKQREGLFYERFSYRIRYFKKYLEKVHTKKAKEDYDKLTRLIAEMKLFFLDKSFWYTTYDFVAYAKKSREDEE